MYSSSSTDNTNVAASTANIKPHETGDNESNTEEFTTNGMYCMVTMYNYYLAGQSSLKEFLKIEIKVEAALQVEIENIEEVKKYKEPHFS